MVFIYIYGHVRNHMFLYTTENLALKTTCQNSSLFQNKEERGGSKEDLKTNLKSESVKCCLELGWMELRGIICLILAALQFSYWQPNISLD